MNTYKLLYVMNTPKVITSIHNYIVKFGLKQQNVLRTQCSELSVDCVHRFTGPTGPVFSPTFQKANCK